MELVKVFSFPGKKLGFSKTIELCLNFYMGFRIIKLVLSNHNKISPWKNNFILTTRVTLTGTLYRAKFDKQKWKRNWEKNFWRLYSIRSFYDFFIFNILWRKKLAEISVVEVLPLTHLWPFTCLRFTPRQSTRSSFRPATLLKRRLSHRCFPVNFAKFLRTAFFTEQLGWLLLESTGEPSFSEVFKEYEMRTLVKIVFGKMICSYTILVEY